MGITDSEYDPDPTYELTTDNVKKILAVYMRFRFRIFNITMRKTIFYIRRSDVLHQSYFETYIT